MSLKLSELKGLHGKGLSLIYLRPKSKRPWEKDWTRTPNKKWAELEASFEKSYNVGVRLGKHSQLPDGRYLGVIDCDVKSKSALALAEMKEMLRQLDLSGAPTVMSGRGNGSRHIYVATKTHTGGFKICSSEKLVKVAMPGETRPHSKREMKRLTKQERDAGMRLRPAWEISFMGDGQQVVLPPSTHPDTGMKYDWATPLSVKGIPRFKWKEFAAERQNLGPAQLDGLSFKAEDVDLWESPLGAPIIELITEGRGCEDRSAGLMRAAMAMCRARFTDNQILSVLSDPDHYLAGAAYDRRKGRKSAVEWLYKHTLLKARHETSVMRYFDHPPSRKESRPLPQEEAEELAEALVDDGAAELDRDGNGKPKPTVKNVVTVLEQHMAGGLVGFDEFGNRAVFLKDTLYGGRKGRELTDNDDLHLMHHLACKFGVEPSQDTCLKAHAIVAQRYKFHPVREYIRAAEWDGKPRLDGWLSKAFGATGPADYVRAVARKTLVAAVKRVMEPGCKFDYVLVLEGDQGKGKSRALSTLAGRDWFTDNLGDIHQKDVVDQMTGKWVIEMAELASIRGRENEHVKAFITRQVDRVRPPYGRRSQDFPRQSIFIGSTNNQEYFTDETGNRRYWPVGITEVNVAWLKRHRAQLWAEALTRYELGEDVYLKPEIEALAAREQEKRFEVDDWEAEIKKYVEKNSGPYVTLEVYRALTMSVGHPDMTESKRIGRIMVRLGYSRSVRRFEGVLSKCWIKAGVTS